MAKVCDQFNNILVNEDKQETKIFYQQLIDQSQFVHWRSFECGRTAEVMPSQPTMDTLQLTFSEIDSDVMNYLHFMYAFPQTQRAPSAYKGRVLKIHPQSTHIRVCYACE